MYQCKICGHVFEKPILAPDLMEPIATCPKCGDEAIERKIEVRE